MTSETATDCGTVLFTSRPALQVRETNQMVILQAILALILRAAGTLVNTAFGWATAMLFGKVPQDRQLVLSVVCSLAIVWFALALGIVFPRFAVFVLTFIPVSSLVNTNWIRVIMLGLTLVVPFLNGFLSFFLVAPKDRPTTTKGRVHQILKGWPFTVGLATTMMYMFFYAPIIKLVDTAKGWKAVHIAVVIEPKQYPVVLTQLTGILKAEGFSVTSKPQSFWMRIPVTILTFFSSSTVKRYLTNKLTTIVVPDAEIEVHPGDLILRGAEKDVNHLQATILDNFDFGSAYLTWTKQANELEDKLRDLWVAINEDPRHPHLLEGRLAAIDLQIRASGLSVEEWQVLYRQKLKIELLVLRLTEKRQERKAS